MSQWHFQLISEWPMRAVSSHVFYHPVMIKVWLDTYRLFRDMEPIFIRAISADCELFIPLVLWRKNWKNAYVRTIIPVGYSDYDYMNPIVSNSVTTTMMEAFWSELIGYIQQHYRFDCLCFDGITDVAAVGSGWRKGEICPLLDLRNINSEDELMAFFKTSLRGDIRRQMRRLSELGDLKFREYSCWDELSHATFTEFMKQHSLRWPYAYKAPHFHENLLKAGLKAGIVHFSTLSVNSTEIAWHLGFSYQGRYYYYMPAGSQEYFKYSPTKVHLFYLVRRAVELGFAVFDHLRGEENYKSGWSNDYQFVNTLSLVNDRIMSRIKFNMLKIRGLITPP